MELQGYHATGVNQILSESGAPKGSLYYYFPDGKDGLTAEAIERTAVLVAERIQTAMAVDPDPAVAIPAFIRTLAHYVALAEYRSGGPISAIALEVASTNERLNTVCRAAFERWRDAFAVKLEAGGYDAAQALSLAALILAGIEGGTMLARTQRSPEPLQQIALQIETLLRCHAAS